MKVYMLVSSHGNHLEFTDKEEHAAYWVRNKPLRRVFIGEMEEITADLRAKNKAAGVDDGKEVAEAGEHVYPDEEHYGDDEEGDGEDDEDDEYPEPDEDMLTVICPHCHMIVGKGDSCGCGEIQL